jgi:UV damage endonuclease UvdE
MKKIGFACKWIDHPYQVNSIKPKDDCKKYNTSSTTVSWLNRQSKNIAVEKLWTLMQDNIESTYKLVKKVGNLDAHLRMVRLSSDILPVYTEPNWSWFWKQPDVIDYAEKQFSKIGKCARDLDVRLSFHPGQFCVLASDDPGIVNRSIEEFEYHADMARWMGYGKSFQDFKINVHIAGRAGPEGIRSALGRLSQEARNCITIENDEITWGIEHSLELCNDLALVLDIHHHYIHSGEYIQANDNRIKQFIDSWRGVRPAIHYSASREDVLIGHSSVDRPNMEILLANGYKKSKLRAHSDFMWNRALNEWAYEHWQWADVMVECKSKNLGAHHLYEFWKKLENPMI